MYNKNIYLLYIYIIIKKKLEMVHASVFRNERDKDKSAPYGKNIIYRRYLHACRIVAGGA